MCGGLRKPQFFWAICGFAPGYLLFWNETNCVHWGNKSISIEGLQKIIQ